jgi:hypothetical protein
VSNVPSVGDRVPTSVMPKGVEHTTNRSPVFVLVSVPTSVMPKGVEHIMPVLPGVQSHSVPTSVMPKGVEHNLYVGTTTGVLLCPPL